MPIVMISYGHHFGLSLLKTPQLNNYFIGVIKKSFIIGVFGILIFKVLLFMGTAIYDAIDIWNILLAIPYFMINGGSNFVLLLLISLLFISGKRVTLIVGLCMFFWFKLYRSGCSKYIYFSIVILILILIILIMNSGIELPDFRFFRTLSYVKAGEYDLAFAGRISESQAALSALLSDSTGIYFGAGLGGEFYPWPNLIGSEDYISHYTHFTFVSYIWIGGIAFPFLVYFILFRLLYKLSNHAVKHKNLIYYIFSLYLLMAIVSSLSGAVLMNNSFLWLIIGSSFGLISNSVKI
jgi:hypothetical protein